VSDRLGDAVASSLRTSGLLDRDTTDPEVQVLVAKILLDTTPAFREIDSLMKSGDPSKAIGASIVAAVVRRIATPEITKLADNVATQVVAPN
jgi:hypothetical protein